MNHYAKKTRETWSLLLWVPVNSYSTKRINSLSYFDVWSRNILGMLNKELDPAWSPSGFERLKDSVNTRQPH